MQRCTLGLLAILALVVTLVAVPLASKAQPTAKVWHIGYLGQGDPSLGIRDALLQGLRDMGYIEGQHIMIETRSGQGKFEPLAALAAELVRLPVEVLVTAGVAATLAAKAATSTTPIVFAYVPDPVDMGLIASWARPGGNLTGVANAGVEFMTGKHMELLKALVPTATRIAMLVNPDNPGYGLGRKAGQAAAQRLQMALYFMEVRDPETELERAFAALTHEQIDALLVVGDISFTRYQTRIVELAAERRLPAVYLFKAYVKVGGLMAYEPERLGIYRRAGVMVGQILRGTKPAEIPAEYPMAFELSLNLKTAQALGLTIPPSLLIQADEVIK